MSTRPKLTESQARVLGSLVEKSVTTPDQYPLTLNAIRLACNQKTSREPVVNYDENTIRNALRALESSELIKQRSLSDSRVPKWEHRMNVALDITEKEQSLLCMLLLRGPQTLGELKQRTERLSAFNDLQEVEKVLQRLMHKEPEPFVELLARQPGQKEARYRQLLAPEATHEARAPATEQQYSETPLTEASHDVEARISALEQRLSRLEAQLGLSDDED